MRTAAAATVAAIAFAVALASWSVSPAGYDFVALYASARLVATGHAADVVDRDALLRAEHEALPERDVFLNNPNPPALALLMAPLGLLPFRTAYAVWLALLVAALALAAFLLAPLAAAEQRQRLYPFALLAPPSLVALTQGQTSPLVLLAIAASLRVPPVWSGALVGLVALRPQLVPLLALVALTDARRRLAFLVVAAAVALVSLALVGTEGVAKYLDLALTVTDDLRPGDLGLPSLARRIIGGDAAVGLALAGATVAVLALVVLRAEAGRRTVIASLGALLAAPHVLEHDAVAAYPAVAAASATTRDTVVWVGSGLAAALLQQAGVPVAPVWLAALLVVLARR